MKSSPLLLWIPVLLCFPAMGEALVKIEADHPAIRYVGRFTPHHESEWSGSSISLQFTGSTLIAHLQSQQPTGMEVILNGASRFLLLNPRQTRYVLAEDLEEDRLHEVTLFRRSEATFGTVRFLGFEIESGGKIEPSPASDRRMLIVGDSITCGYANETLDTNQGNTAENQNGYLSYGAITARELNADLHMICWSGRGLFRNRMLKYEQHETLPKIFDRTLPSRTEKDWDHSVFVPDIVVINLGTNDATDLDGKKEPLRREDFVKAYQTFLRRIRSFAPDSTLLLTLGPMGGHTGPITREWLEEAAAPFDDAHVLLFPGYNHPSEIGGHWHPSVEKHHEMAKVLVEKITAVTEWTSAPSADAAPVQK